MSKFAAKIVSGNGTMTCVIDGVSYTVDKHHVNHQKLRDAWNKNNADDFKRLVDVTTHLSQTVKTRSAGKAELIGQEIYYNGKPLHNEMTRRMLQILREGEDIGYLLLFIEKLMQNPSKRAVEELYTFLSHKNLPITEEGDFLAYKCVRENYLDKHSGTYDNSPGAVLEMSRNEVDDNCNNTCSYGFHAGSLEYSGPSGSFWSNTDKVIIVRINPADVASIPADHNAQKLRTAKYVVVDNYKNPLSRSVYSGKAVNDAAYNADEYEHEEDSDIDDVDIYLDSNDIRVNDILSFDYVSHGINRRRNVAVKEINWGKNYLLAELIYPESAIGETRCFKLNEIEDIILESN